MTNNLDSLRRIINGQTLVVTSLAVLSTFLCRRHGLMAEFPLTLIATAIIFPLVFSISGAYKRREAALDDYGSLKANGRAIFLAARDWLPEPDVSREDEARRVLRNLFEACRTLFRTPVPQMKSREEDVYAAFSDISIFVRSLRESGLAGGEVSRCNQYLSKMIVAFENIKHIYQYRTPRTLRAYSQFFIYILPILYGPYFAQIATEFSRGLEYLMPVLYSVILVSLENIQEHLENPFDQIGEDDVIINSEKFISRLAGSADVKNYPRIEAEKQRRSA